VLAIPRFISLIEWLRERTDNFHYYETEKITREASDAAEYIDILRRRT